MEDGFEYIAHVDDGCCNCEDCVYERGFEVCMCCGSPVGQCYNEEDQA